MTSHPPEVCPTCGQPIPESVGKDSAVITVEPSEAGTEEHREYDHRGILLPRQTRVGGIIIPQ